VSSLRRFLKIVLGVPLAALVIAGATLGLDSENGLEALWDLRRQEREARSEIATLEGEAKVLEEQIEALRSDPFEIERRAREQLGMVRKDERELRWR
jgi:cell division protein FtsB